MRYTYKTKNTCSRSISFDIDESGVVRNISFVDGCPGNLSALSVLCEGMTAGEIAEKLSPVRCGRKKTSCGHQLSLAVQEAYNSIREGKI